MVKTRLLSMVLALTMVFAMAPLSMGVAFADEGNAGEAADNNAEDHSMLQKDDPQLSDDESDLYNLFVGGEQVGPNNMSGEGWNYSGDAVKGTLTLKNAQITNSEQWSSIESYEMDITLKLEGNNVIGDGTNFAAIYFDYDYDQEMHESGSLTIEGTGTLTATGVASAIQTYVPLTFKSGTVNAHSSGNTEGAMGAIASCAGMDITGGTINAIGGRTQPAIFSTDFTDSAGDKSLTISGGKLTAEVDNVEPDMDVYDAILVERGALTISNGADITTKNGDIYCCVEVFDKPSISITDSKVQTEGAINGEVINIKDSEVTATGDIGLVCDILNLNNTGSGKYVTRVEATADNNFLMPQSDGDGDVTAKRFMQRPAILAYEEFNINDDLKIVEPAGGVVKNYPLSDWPDAFTVFDGDTVAEHVIIQGGKKAGNTAPFITSVRAKGKKKLVISWGAMKGAQGYDIYMSLCNKGKKKGKMKLVKTINGGGANTWIKKKLKKKRSYKVVIKAWTMKNGKKTYIAASPVAHVYTSGGRGKYTNAKSVSVKQPYVTLNKGGTFMIKAKVKKVKKGKKLVRTKHAKPLRYMTTNAAVARVDVSGKITAVGTGTCKVFVYTSNGLSAPVTVTVR